MRGAGAVKCSQGEVGRVMTHSCDVTREGESQRRPAACGGRVPRVAIKIFLKGNTNPRGLPPLSICLYTSLRCFVSRVNKICPCVLTGNQLSDTCVYEHYIQAVRQMDKIKPYTHP